VADLDPADGPFLILDIGGGSTELVAGSGPDDPDLATVSLQLGCVRVSERFLSSDPPTPAELTAAEQMVAEALEQAVTDHPRFLDKPRLVGLAGTVSTLSSLQSGSVTYDRDAIHHSVLSLDQVEHWYRVLASDDHAGRLGRPGMVAGREDVIVGGAMILSVVMRRLGLGECLVSEADILDGLVASLVRR
jgi:exopolyphosphatase/guanosine-5'-triphosphate,3'-diphosphate pyrophosphatase